jgi:hypothetical protein
MVNVYNMIRELEEEFAILPENPASNSLEKLAEFFEDYYNTKPRPSKNLMYRNFDNYLGQLIIEGNLFYGASVGDIGFTFKEFLKYFRNMYGVSIQYYLNYEALSYGLLIEIFEKKTN